MRGQSTALKPGLPLTPALSPRGRGSLAFTLFTDSLAKSYPIAPPPLPAGERAGVRGGPKMRPNKVQTHNARILRQIRSDAETLLWNALRNRRFNGLKFRRQTPVTATRTADFLCKEHRLVLLLDRNDDPATDLTARGYRVLHLSSHDIRDDLPGALNRLQQEIRP